VKHFRLSARDEMQLKSWMADCRSLQSRETNDSSQTTWIKPEGSWCALHHRPHRTTTALSWALGEQEGHLAIDDPSKLACISRKEVADGSPTCTRPSHPLSKGGRSQVALHCARHSHPPNPRARRGAFFSHASTASSCAFCELGGHSSRSSHNFSGSC
jgi:hypothetical protein